MNHPLSPLDGRYAAAVADLSVVFSEFGLMATRTQVEIEWLILLSQKGIGPKFSAQGQKKLRKIYENFSDKDYQAIKKIEVKTNHDVKAVEYFLQGKVARKHWSFLHFACTSEDINNTAYGLMVQRGRAVVLTQAEVILKDLKKKARAWKAVPMLCRTHGQPATPSTMGKEIAVFAMRLQSQIEKMRMVRITAKMNGATGTFAAHHVAYPKVDWMKLSEQFIEKNLKLGHSPLTTQIEPHDHQVELLGDMGQASNILIGLCRDIWGYVSLGYFGQRVVAGEVGSSTMPHKVNPIDFENAEGNLKLCRGLAQTLGNELPISRWQRDLTDSTLQRNLGLVFGHFLLGLKSLGKGLGKLEINRQKLKQDLQNTPEVLAEAVQTVLRAHGQADAYEQLKAATRGKAITLEGLKTFIESTTLPESEKNRLLKLRPEDYTGLAQKLVEQYLK